MLSIRSPTPRHWVFLMLLVVLWGSRYFAADIALRAYAPLDVVFLPMLIAAALLWIIMRVTGERLPRDSRTWLYFNAMAVFGNGLPYFLEAWGLLYIESALVGILMSVSPLCVLLLAHLLLADERADRGRVSGFVVGAVGVTVLIGPAALGQIGGDAMRVLAQLAILGAAFCYGLSAVLTRLAPQHPPRVVAAGVLIAAALQLLPFWLYQGGLDVQWVPGAPSLAVLGIGVLCIALAALVFFRLIAEVGATFQALANYLTPLWAVFAGYVILGERLSPNAFVGLILILLALWLTERRRRVRA